MAPPTTSKEFENASKARRAACHQARQAERQAMSSDAGPLAIPVAPEPATAIQAPGPPSTDLLATRTTRNSYWDRRHTVNKLSKTGIDDDESGPSKGLGTNAENDGPPPAPGQTTKVDVPKVHCTVLIRAGDAPNLLRFPGVASLGTDLGCVQSAAQLHALVDGCHEISHPLKQIYDLDLGHHKETLVSFTDHRGARHTLPLYRLTNSNMDAPADPDGHGKTCTEWKHMIETGRLSEAPKCFGSTCNCNGRFHGVEVIEVLKTESVVATCAAHHQELEGARLGAAWTAEQLQKETEALKARLARLQKEIEALQARVAQLGGEREAHETRAGELEKEVGALKARLQAAVWDDGESDEEDVSEYEE